MLRFVHSNGFKVPGAPCSPSSLENMKRNPAKNVQCIVLPGRDIQCTVFFVQGILCAVFFSSGVRKLRKIIAIWAQVAMRDPGCSPDWLTCNVGFFPEELQEGFGRASICFSDSFRSICRTIFGPDFCQNFVWVLISFLARCFD